MQLVKSGNMPNRAIKWFSSQFTLLFLCSQLDQRYIGLSFPAGYLILSTTQKELAMKRDIKNGILLSTFQRKET